VFEGAFKSGLIQLQKAGRFTEVVRGTVNWATTLGTAWRTTCGQPGGHAKQSWSNRRSRMSGGKLRRMENPIFEGRSQPRSVERIFGSKVSQNAHLLIEGRSGCIRPPLGPASNEARPDGAIRGSGGLLPRRP